MAKDNEDILLEEGGEEKAEAGDVAVGNGELDDCFCILSANTNSFKSDPIIGPNLFMLMNGKVTKTEIRQRVNLHLQRDNKFPKKINVVDGNVGVEL